MQQRVLIMVLGLCLLAGGWLLKTYVNWSAANTIAGLITILVTARVNENKKSGKWLLYLALMLACLNMLAPIKTIFYFLLLFFLAGAVNYFVGSINMLPLLAAIIMSPAFTYAINVFSFYLRLKLTYGVGWLLSIIYPGTQVMGNMITHEGYEFSVDPACMGLHMLVISMLTGLMLVGIFEKRLNRTFHPVGVIGVLLIVTAFNILSNICRIFLLVSGKLLQDTFMHDVTGLGCFLFYILIPMVGIVGWMVRRWGKQPETVRMAKHRNNLWLWLPLAVLVAAITSGYGVYTHQYGRLVQTTSRLYKGYQLSVVEKEIIRLRNDDVLAYVKPIPAFYSSEHHPMICWGGSGYAFTRFETNEINGLKFYTATLKKENESLYTAWWYDNGSVQTINQSDWRWLMLSGGASFSLVNITAASRDALNEQVLYFKNNVNVQDFTLK